MRRIVVIILMSALAVFGAYFSYQNFINVLVKDSVSAQSMYTNSEVFTENVGQVTDIEITPSGEYMLVATLPGKVEIFQKVGGVFFRQKNPFFTVNTAHPGFPPEEAGLTGMFLGADFEKSGEVFFSYSFRKTEDEFENRIGKVKLIKIGNRVMGINFKNIFTANTSGGASHQIQDGVGLLVKEKPYIVFTIGEGFKAERALDPKQEAGKVMLMDTSGNNKKIVATGIRNAPAIALDSSDKIAIADTGPSRYDRLIYGDLISSENLSFNWDGTEESLAKAHPMVIHRWDPTETAVDISYHKGKMYVLLFGQTGSEKNSPGKKLVMQSPMLLGANTNSIIFKTIVERTPEGEGKLGNPLGMAIDSTTGDIYFGDILEGRIYKVTGGETN